MSTARSAADTGVVAATLLIIVTLCWWWIVGMARDIYGPMTGSAAWMMTTRWDGPHIALLFAMWSAMMVRMGVARTRPTRVGRTASTASRARSIVDSLKDAHQFRSASAPGPGGPR
jgi:hypothetical protein